MDPFKNIKLAHVGQLWTAKIAGTSITGSGSRPDLAVRDLKDQIRRVAKRRVSKYTKASVLFARKLRASKGSSKKRRPV